MEAAGTAVNVSGTSIHDNAPKCVGNPVRNRTRSVGNERGDCREPRRKPVPDIGGIQGIPMSGNLPFRWLSEAQRDLAHETGNSAILHSPLLYPGSWPSW